MHRDDLAAFPHGAVFQRLRAMRPRNQSTAEIGRASRDRKKARLGLHHSSTNAVRPRRTEFEKRGPDLHGSRPRGDSYRQASSRVDCIGWFEALAIWHLFEPSQETPAEGHGELGRKP
jgi:hypothetical protein